MSLLHEILDRLIELGVTAENSAIVLSRRGVERLDRESSGLVEAWRLWLGEDARMFGYDVRYDEKLHNYFGIVERKAMSEKRVVFDYPENQTTKGNLGYRVFEDGTEAWVKDGQVWYSWKDPKSHVGALAAELARLKMKYEPPPAAAIFKSGMVTVRENGETEIAGGGFAQAWFPASEMRELGKQYAALWRQAQKP